MALGIATRRAREGEGVSEATALIEGDDGREALGAHRLDGKPLRCFARTPTRKDQPRRPRRLGKATAFHGVGCSVWLGRGPVRCYRGLAKPQARPAKEKPTARETEAQVLNDSRWRSGSPLGESQGGRERFRSHGAYRRGRGSGGLVWSSAQWETVAMLCPHPNV
jgi:hypothetical protein